MSNKSQILCSTDNSIKIELLKNAQKRIRWNREDIKVFKAQLTQLKQNNNNFKIQIQDPYHPSNYRYIEIIESIKESERLIQLDSKWIKIYSESISESTS